MHAIFTYGVVFAVLTNTNARNLLQDHNEIKRNLLQTEMESSLGGTLVLNEEEIIANNILMQWKHEETNEFFQNPHYYNLSKHFFTYKNYIQKSKVYEVMKKIPKGGALHVHSTFMLDVDSILKLTYEDHLYACIANGDLKFKFSTSVPVLPCHSNWTLLSDLRATSRDVRAFDAEIKNNFTIYTTDTNIVDDNINLIWERFEKLNKVVKPLISYRPAREQFFYDCLRTFYEDNIMYVEIRSGLQNLYELNGTIHDDIYLATLFREVTEKFKETHPGFVGAKLILTSRRLANISEIENSLNTARILKKIMPDFFAGFDLVGQEDLGKPLSEFVPAFLEAKNEIDYYFHAGETNWYGKATDENLFDAILLGTKRIGHGYALSKHPNLLSIVKEKDIAVEVNVISNAVLALVRDVRNHPLATYLAQNVPIVLSSDDPGAWNSDPLSEDFYVAFVLVASDHADLRMLKQLALNSIKYSALDDKGKDYLYAVFNEKWELFIRDLIALDKDIQDY